MRYSELTRKLRRLGIKLVEEGKRHEVWAREDLMRRAFIPRHRGEIPAGTLHKILNDLGITREGLDRA